MPDGLTFAEKPTITGDLVILRPVRVADAAALAAVDAETTRLTGNHRTFSRAELEQWNGSRARHVYDRLGFVHEGTKRQALRWDGEWVDAHLMAILRSDWFSSGD